MCAQIGSGQINLYKLSFVHDRIQNMRCLVVEDDPDLRRQLERALSDSGYAVDVAADGEEGHFLGDTEPYDVIVLDLGLPRVDGVTILERWRQAGKVVPVLILTARRWRALTRALTII
jgi:two-component system, OmpR family, response regulator